MKYPKINSIFKRLEKTSKRGKSPLIYGDWSTKEIEYLKDCKWECTEKIDGTNTHIDITIHPDHRYYITYHGRTEKSNIPLHLLLYLEKTFNKELIKKVFTPKEDSVLNVSICGEGYGMKIQNGHNYIPNECSFILFDVNINGVWLERHTLENLASQLGIKIVPMIGYMTIDEAIDMVKEGFQSTITPTEYLAEGLVLKTPNGLKDRMGNRIMTKIKHKDFSNIIYK